MPTTLVQVAGMATLGVQGIGADQDLVQVQLVEQGDERGDLAALRIHLYLPEHRAAVLVDHRHQMRRRNGLVASVARGAGAVG